MNKIKSIIMIVASLLMLLYPQGNIYAQNENTSYIEELSDGYYASINTEIQIPLLRTSERTVVRTYSILSSSNKIVASYTLTATFSYPYNDTAKCTSASYKTSIFDSHWSFITCSSSSSGNKASGHFIAKQTSLGITTSTINKTITLTCDKNGNIK